jgi:hypothetical protein
VLVLGGATGALTVDGPATPPTVRATNAR